MVCCLKRRLSVLAFSSGFQFIPGNDEDILFSYQSLIGRKAETTWCALGKVNVHSKAIYWYDPLPGHCVMGGMPSPDGNQIAFTTHSDDDDSWTHQLAIMDVDGSNLKFLTNEFDFPQIYRGSLSFSSSGQKPAYLRQES